MSTRASSKRPVKVFVRDSQRRKMVLDVDLNDMPPCENRADEGTTTSSSDAQVGQFSGPGGASTSVNGRLLSVPIDVEAIDDEVVISSPRRFAEARNHSRRNQVVTVVLDEDSDAHQNHSGSIAEEPITSFTLNSFNNSKRNSALEAIINCELYINLENNQSPKRTKVLMPSTEPPQNTVPKEPIFSCAICMGPLVKETSTTCGHIFCMKCIKDAIAAQKKCPTCRHKLTARNIHRVYLPTTD